MESLDTLLHLTWYLSHSVDKFVLKGRAHLLLVHPWTWGGIDRLCQRRRGSHLALVLSHNGLAQRRNHRLALSVVWQCWCFVA